MDDLKTIGKNIVKFRKQKGLTQEDLCGLTEIDRSYLSQIENGRINVTIKTLVVIARVLKVDLADLTDK